MMRDDEESPNISKHSKEQIVNWPLKKKQNYDIPNAMPNLNHINLFFFFNIVKNHKFELNG